MRIRTRRAAGPGLLLDAKSLAGAILAVCEFSLDERQRGRCLGSGISRWIEIGVPAIVIRGPLNSKVMKREVRRAHQHAMFGHDDGCNTFGLSSRELELLLQRHDGDQAYSLLYEAFLDAVEEVSSGWHGWSRELASGVLESQICGRITPLRLGIEKAGSALLRVPNPP